MDNFRIKADSHTKIHRTFIVSGWPGASNLPFFTTVYLGLYSIYEFSNRLLFPLFNFSLALGWIRV